MPAVPMEMPSDTVIVLNSHALAARLVRSGAGLPGEAVDVHVAGRHHAPRRGDADLRLAEILVLESDGPQHRAARRVLDAVHDESRVLARVDSCSIVRCSWPAFVFEGSDYPVRGGAGNRDPRRAARRKAFNGLRFSGMIAGSGGIHSDMSSSRIGHLPAGERRQLSRRALLHHRRDEPQGAQRPHLSRQMPASGSGGSGRTSS